MHTNQFVYYFFITDSIMSMIKLGVNNVNFITFEIVLVVLLFLDFVRENGFMVVH